MKAFMDKDFMLQNETAVHLFHDYSENLPIIDYHCHLNPQEIYEDRRFNNIAEIWLGGRNDDGSYAGDHYKWRLMRSNGYPEEMITGGADPYDKFVAFADTLEMAIGNPMYHWSNLELKKYFGVDVPLTVDNAKEIWDKTADMLQNDPDKTVRGLIRGSNVAFVGTTDDPIDSLEWHEKLAAEPDLGFQVRPSFRPDKAINIQKAGWAEYIGKLGEVVGRELKSAQDVIDALYERVDFFKAHGCRATDHGLDYFPFAEGTIEEANAIFTKAMAGEKLTKLEVDQYQTQILLALGRKYAKDGFVMEIHYSCTRNNNKRICSVQGADTGFDMIAKSFCYNELAQFLSALDETEELPKTILFSLDESDLNQLATMIGCFQSEEVPGKVQLGAAWWFLDHRDGMEKQMKSLASLGLLGTFTGMLTDSRSFLSYARHDYFRRIACNLIGQWVENGEYPNNEASLKKIVEGISYYNAKRYFNI